MIWMFFAVALASYGSTCCAKLNSKTVSTKSGVAYVVVLLFNGLTACAFFAISSLFRLSLTPKTLMYATCYALAVTCSLLSALKIYRLIAVSNASLLSMATSLLVTSALGWILFHEQVTWLKVVRIFLMLCSAVLVFLGVKVKEKQRNATENCVKQEEKSSRTIWKLSFLLICTLLSSVVSTLVIKFYTLDSKVADNNSLFFFTNAVLILGSTVAFFILKTREKATIQSVFAKFKLREFVFMVGNTLCSNVVSLVQALLIKKMDLSVYQPTVSAIGVCCALAVSLTFREKIGKCTVLAVVLALVAIFI